MEYHRNKFYARRARDYELIRIEIITLLIANHIKFDEAQLRLGLCRSQLYKIISDYKRHGPISCLSRKIGYSNRQHPLPCG